MAFQRASCRQDSKPPCATRSKAFLKDLLFPLRSIKPDPLDAWGAQSKLEIEEGGGWSAPRHLHPAPLRAQSRGAKKKKKRTEMEAEKKDIWKAATSSLSRRLLCGLSHALCYPRAWILSGCKEKKGPEERRKRKPCVWICNKPNRLTPNMMLKISFCPLGCKYLKKNVSFNRIFETLNQNKSLFVTFASKLLNIIVTPQNKIKIHFILLAFLLLKSMLSLFQ